MSKFTLFCREAIFVASLRTFECKIFWSLRHPTREMERHEKIHFDKYNLTNTIWQIQFEKCILRDSWPFGKLRNWIPEDLCYLTMTMTDKDKDKDKDIWDIRDTSDNSNNYWQFWKISTFLTLILTVDSDNWQSRHLLILTLKGDPTYLPCDTRHVTFETLITILEIENLNCEFCFQNSSPIFTFRPLFVRHQAWHPSISPLYDILEHTSQIFSESLWRPLFTHPPPLTFYPNTNTQIHKYTNTALVKVEHRHNMCYIFEKVMIRGPQK